MDCDGVRADNSDYNAKPVLQMQHLVLPKETHLKISTKISTFLLFPENKKNKKFSVNFLHLSVTLFHDTKLASLFPNCFITKYLP